MQELRILSTREVRASATGGKLKVGGYAARYGVLSSPIQPGVKERIAKRAFDGVLRKKPDVVCTFNHDANHVLGRTTSGTLQLRSDDTGLQFECELPNTNTARDLHESIRRGDINGCSFAFALGQDDDSFGEEDDPEDRGSKVIVRTIKNFKQLMDVSICTNPCYPGTSVDARSNHVVTAELRSRIDSFSREERSKAFARKYPSLRGSLNIQANLDNFDQLEAPDSLILARRRSLLDF